MSEQGKRPMKGITRQRLERLTPQVAGVTVVEVEYLEEARVFRWLANTSNYRNICVFKTSYVKLRNWSESEFRNRLTEALVNAASR